MSALTPKRSSRTKRPRPSHVAPAVISSAPCDVSADSSDSNSSKSKEAAQREDALLKTTKILVYAEELFSDNVTLSDPRIQAIRRQVENDMPKLYELSQDYSPSHTSSETSLIMRIAEDFLKKFPDAPTTTASQPQSEAPLRTTLRPAAEIRHSPAASVQLPANVSPVQPGLSHPAVPDTAALQTAILSVSHPVPISSAETSPGLGPNQSIDAQSLPRPPPITSAMHPSPVVPLPSDISAQPASYSDTRVLYPPNTSRPPVWGSLYEAATMPSHLQEAVKQTTQHQKMVLFAVHELLRKRSMRHARQPWYEPPIGLSPEELISAQEQRTDPRFQCTNFSGQYAQHRPPAHPPSRSSAASPYAFPENRSVAVARSVPRSASMD